MKKIFFWMTLLCLAVQANVSAQPGEFLVRDSPDTIASYPLAITERYTTNLIFPFGIVKADLGSGEVIAKKWGKAENVLLLKAARANFLSTNVSVYLANGALYSFSVHYSDTVSAFNFSFRRDSLPTGTSREASVPRVRFGGAAGDVETLEKDAGLLKKAPAFIHIRASSGKVRLALRRLYIKNGLLWMGFGARNKSQIDFRSGSLHFSIRDKRRISHAAVQSIEVEPVFATGHEGLAGGGQSFPVAAFTPFMVAHGKKVVVEWQEGNGGRLIRMVIPARKLLKARKF